MLSEADRKKLAFLNHLVVEQGSDISRDEVKWLLGRLQSFLFRPDEFNFPDYACLINEKEQAAIALRRHIKPNWSKDLILKPAPDGRGAEVLCVAAECPTHNAFLLVRPWIRALPEVPDADFERLRLCSVGLTLDAETLLSDSPIEEILIAKDGGGLRLPVLLRSPSHYVYPAAELMPGDANADPTKVLGVFVPNTMVVRLFVKTPPNFDGWSVKVVAGFTVMEYTSRPKAWDSSVEIPPASVESGPFVKTG